MEDGRELLEAFVTASRVLTAVAVRSVDAGEPEVTVAQHRLLVLLAARGPQFIKDVATELNVNGSNASRQCDRLARKGLLERSRSSADGRVVCVSLTALGRGLVEQVTAARRAEIASILARMPANRSAAALSALHSFNEAAGELADRDWATRSRGD